jgi:tryptophan-rich sensory protein
MMGIAAGLVWDRMDSDKEGVKGINIICDTTGAKCFVVVFIFGLRNPMLAGLEIIVLWLMIYETYIHFAKINKIAGYLFLPYLACKFRSCVEWKYLVVE